MPNYFFHLRSTVVTDRDELGSEFADLNAAYLDTCEAISGIAADLAKACCSSSHYVFDITDAAGRLLMEVPFTEIVNKGEKAQRPAPNPSPWKPLPEVERTQRLAGDIGEQTLTLRETVRQSRALVARSQSAKRWCLHRI